MAKPRNNRTNESGSGKGARHVTSYDVAKFAGVSQSAVSRCFKPGASVSQEMKDRVMKAANELGYAPNAIARSLITRRSNLVAVLISNLTNLYYPEVLSRLTQSFSKEGIRVLLFAVETEGQTDKILQQIFQYQVDGVVAAVKISNDRLKEFEKRQVPLVFYNRIISNASAAAVCCDQAEGAKSLVHALYASGHRTFGFVDGPVDSIVGQERKSATLSALKELGFSESKVTSGDYSYECGYEAIDKFVNHGGIPDAIVCANDMTAFGVIDALRFSHNKRVPEDVSVVGFDGVGAAYWASYNLTTIRQPVGRMTSAAVSMLLDLIEEPTRPIERRLFSGALVKGNSARLCETD